MTLAAATSTRRPRDLLLTVSAVAGVLCLLVVAALALTHSRPVVFRSGSMAPAIDVGAVAVVHRVPADRLEVGDVVTVPQGDSDVTHRIVQLTRGQGQATIQLQGDANTVPDSEVHEVTSAERLVFAVPRLGYLVAALTGPFGLLLIGTYVVWLLRRFVAGSAPRGEVPPGRGGPGGRHRDPTDPGPGRRSRVLVSGLTIAAVVVVGSASVLAPRAYAAGWPDTATVSGTTLTARTVPAPATFSCGGLGILNVTFTWSAVPGAVSYDVHYGANGSTVATVTTTSAQLTSAINGGTAWVQANMAYGTTTWTSAPSVSRNYTVAVVSLCG